MGARALSLAGARDMLDDGRVWCVLGTVALDEGDTEHYEVNAEGDIELTVVTHKHGVPLRAVLAGSFGSAAGAWAIPSAGDEVLVAFADGEFEGDAIVVACTSSRRAPAGLAPGTVLLKADTRVQADAPEVLLGGGAGHEVTFKAETFLSALDALLTALSSAIGSSGTPGGATAAQTALELPGTGALALFEAAMTTAKTTVTKVK